MTMATIEDGHKVGAEGVITAAGLAAAGALAFAFFAEHVWKLHPCILCLYQRWPYAGIIALSVLFLIVARVHPQAARTMGFSVMVALALLFLGDAAIAGYHVGVEQKWWTGTESCSGPSNKAATIDELRAQIMATPVTRCDDIAWSLLGISMAGWNMLFAGAAGIAVSVNAMALRRSPKR